MLNKIIEIIENPIKAAYAVLSGTTLGYIPNAVREITEINESKIDTMFQHSVWTITILVGLTALISWTQKQIDRYRKNKKVRSDE